MENQINELENLAGGTKIRSSEGIIFIRLKDIADNYDGNCVNTETGELIHFSYLMPDYEILF